MRRRARGEAHNVPGSHALRSSRCRTTKPTPRDTAVAATKYGRSGSNVAASPAPESPSATATRGPAQQSAEAMAATMPPVAAATVLAPGDGMILLQRLEYRAVRRGTTSFARCGEVLERALQPLELSDLPI